MRGPPKLPREMTKTKTEWNEERLRTHVLMPYLDALGLSLASIHVEYQFSVRLGRKLHQIDGKLAQGRADALIKNTAGDNLFVVELKRPDKTLKANDGDQGISYARLLDKIAPFVVVSNGKETQIYDTITKKRLDGTTFNTQSEFFKNGCRLLSGDDVQIRFEAMEYFVGHSEENVAAFSKGQIEASIRSLRERPGGLGKYVRELYVPRDLVRRAFNEFLDHDAQVFSLVGESGVGKTNEMCALAESFSATHMVLFFACHSLNQAPECALSDEFNWSFSQRLETPALCKQLAQLAERRKKPVLIFFDALDEAQTAGFSVSLSNFAKHLAPFSPNIRLVVSAKRSEWIRFASLRGNASDLALGMSFADAKELPNLLAWKPGTPLTLDQFSESERDAAIERYEQKFNLTTVTQSRSRALLRHPFFLRVYGETYEGQSEIPTEITSDGLIRKWLCKKFEFSEVPDDALWLRIKQIAERIYTKNRNRGNLPQNSDSLESIEVDKLNGLEWNELVTHDILVKSADEENRIAVRFYYSQVLYFLISRHVLQLDKLEAQAFGEHLPILLENYVLQEVLRSHLRSIPVSHSRELEKQISGRALTFLTTYSEIFDRLAPALRPCVLPYTQGEMGLGYIAEDPMSVYFGFYAVSPENPKYVTRVYASSLESAFEALNKLRCVGSRGSSDNFVSSEPRLAAARLAYEQIKKAIDQGRLDERKAQTLMVESVLAIVGDSETRRKLRLRYGTYDLSMRQSLLPVDLADLTTRAQEYFGVQTYLARHIDEGVQPKAANATTNSNLMAGFDSATALMRVKAELQNGADFASHWYDQELSHLVLLIEQLKLQGVVFIDSDICPAPDLPIIDPLLAPLEAYSDLQLEALFRSFLQESYGGFVNLIEANFGRLSSLLSIFGQRPYRIVTGCKREKQSTSDRVWGWFCWGAAHTEGIATEVRVFLNPSEQFFSRAPDGSPLLGGYEVESLTSTDIQRIFHPFDAVSFSGAERFMATNNAPIRAFAYSLIQEDWKGITAEKLLELLDKA